MGVTSYLLKKILPTALFGIFYVPPIVYGVYLFICWIRIHISNIYYGDCSYPVSALLWIGVGLVIFGVTWYGAWRRSFYGLLFIVPLFLGLVSTHVMPDTRPSTTTLVSDFRFASKLTQGLRDWYEKREKFPADESEFWEAIASGTPPAQYRAGRGVYSKYKQQGNLLPYVVIVVGNASGPRVADVSPRPGVIYYCVSSDLQEIWITMTGLESDLASRSSLRMLDSFTSWETNHWIHRIGRDYQVKSQ